MRYSLRTLLVVMTLIALYLGCYVHALRRDGKFLTGTNWSLRNAPDSQAIAKLVREQIGALPAHTFTDERLFELSEQSFAAGHFRVASGKPVDQFFCRVKLSDGSETNVGFWIYSRKGSTGVTYAVSARDFYLDRPADQRWTERHALMDRYFAMLVKIQDDLEDAF